MLKISIFFFVLMLSLPALACYRLQGKLAVDGETHQIDQKIDHAKQYSLPMGNFILHLNFSPFKDLKTKHHMKFSLHEKKGTKLVLVTQGEEDIDEKESREFYLKGVPGQPNTIINLQLTNI